MWTTLALAAITLAPAQGGTLELTNVRPTYGVLGAPRQDSKYLPGDTLYLAFEIDHIKVDVNGTSSYSMTLEVTDSNGKTQLKDKGAEKTQVTNYLGGNRLPAFAHVDIGLDQPKGEYTLKISVTDLGAKGGKPAELTRKFEVLAPGFGVVKVSTSYDPDGQVPAPMLGVVGQLITINFVVVGYERDKSKAPQPDFEVEMAILDEKGNKTLPKAITDKVPNKALPAVPGNLKALDLHFPLPLSRTGSYTIELTVKDNLAKKTQTVKLPLKVMALDAK